MTPRVGAVVALPPEHERYKLKLAEKAIGQESQAIEGVTQDEDLRVVAHNLGHGGGVVVVTDRRAFTMRKGRIEKSIAHADVAETTIGTMPVGTELVQIISQSAALDFRANDPRRFTAIIQAEVASARIGNVICHHVDTLSGKA